MILLAKHWHKATVIALSAVTHKSVDFTVTALKNIANKEMKNLGDVAVVETYLKSLGYVQVIAPKRDNGQTYTLQGLCDELKSDPFRLTGRIVLVQPIIADLGRGRMVAIENGTLSLNKKCAWRHVKSYWLQPAPPCYGETHWT